MADKLINEEIAYVQSANTLFTFMKEEKFLTNALDKSALVPRYCEENIRYLNIRNNDRLIESISVLQKCFCDIPLHKLTENFPVELDNNEMDTLSEKENKELRKHNTHPDYYGGFAIAFSKRWCVKNNLQPVQYINSASELAKSFKTAFEYELIQEDLANELFDDMLNRLALSKPLQGVMNRRLENGTLVHINKNFHDEKEWRYLPRKSELYKDKKGVLIFKPSIKKSVEEINKELENISCRDLWLKFDYDDIKYLIVPFSTNRVALIGHIMELPDDNFNNDIDIDIQKHILISKILVLEEIREDW